ncbi:MAG: hypothetical protein ACRDF0_09060, partial [Candidatus Limnocylindria bacterium]
LFVQHGGRIAVLDAASGTPERSFQATVAAPDWSALYRLEPTEDATTISALDVRDGATLRRNTISGSYDFPHAYTAAPSGLSPDGRWLALAGPKTKVPATSRFAVLDTATLRPVARIELGGDFSYDALGNDGRSLYLVEHPRPGETVYLVRVWDLERGALLDGVIADPKQRVVVQGVLSAAQARQVQLMNGIYHTSLPSKDGSWLYSLYFSPTEGPFIHALNLRARNAFCILGLPVVAGADLKRSMWALAMAPRGDRLYVANGALGVVAEIDTAALKVLRTSRVDGLGEAGAASTRFPAGGAVVSPDGRQLYVVGERGLLAVDTAKLSVRATHLPDHAIAAVALSPDGKRLYALGAAGGEIWGIDAVSGGALATITTTGSATAILRVTSR